MPMISIKGGAITPAAPAARTAPRARIASLGGEALRYLAASVAALAVDAGLLWFATSAFGWPAWLAGAIGYGTGLVVAYLLSIHWVFATRAVRDPRREFVLFAATGLAGLVLNSATLQVATSLGASLPVAKVLSAGIGFTVNFCCRKVVLFSRGRA